jgi:hypothetical protein
VSQDVQALVDRLYKAFNDSFLGGTDEAEVSKVLTIAFNERMMRDVDKLYRSSYPNDLSLREEFDDELSGDDLEDAVRLWDEGMKQEPKPAPASNPAQSGPVNPVHATLTPKPSAPSDEIEIDVEVPTPEERQRLGKQGVNLPVVSAGSADPRKHSDYVDNRLDAVGFGIYLGGYMLYFKGMDMPVFVPEDHFDFSDVKMAPVDLAIFPDYASASQQVQSAPAGAGKPYAYYRGAGGAVIAPTLFTPETAPHVIRTALEARRKLAKYVQDELTSVAIGIVAGMIIRAVVGWIVRVSGGKGGKTPTKLPKEAVKARELAKQARDRGEPVIANMGGAGASHEAPGAINVNNQAVGRKVIPKHVNSDASEIGPLFDPASVDQVVGYHMPPGVIKWPRAVPGIRSALKPGGTFRFDWRGANAEAAKVAKMLEEAGFKDVKNWSDTLVTATKPL